MLAHNTPGTPIWGGYVLEQSQDTAATAVENLIN
jgi:hypothetical protein